MRIEIPAHYDLWMRGARFGTVKDTLKDGTWRVRMDHHKVPYLVKIKPEDQEYCKVL